ncbi:pyruvate decarboxylase [Penicillium soppii]|uniref:pyruvate decarboxylase n=1 Tax=Penicillium soppii TaxID=69789 RepID=UPI002546F43E|nr:pyruvate decarboxylase [Penicillium soppii]KAJ5852648.1 pyruvate decarboxylase [Penicillium soppii]
MSALMTVIGVGELSALNAIAGAYAEYVPIVHIVAKPSTQAQKNRLCVHHSLGDGDFTVFEEMSRKVSCMTVNIDNAQTAPSLINEAIKTCWIQSRPVTMFIPCDMALVPIPHHLLNEQPVLDRTMPQDDMVEHRRVVDAMVDEIQQATNPAILVGGYGILHGPKQQLDEFLHHLEVPVLVAASGLGIVDASLPHFAGLYVGSCSTSHVLNVMKTVDLVICVGNIQSDLSTSGFSGIVDHTRLIEIQRTRTTVKGQPFEGVYASNVLSALTLSIGKGSLRANTSTAKKIVCVDISHQRQCLTSVDTNTSEKQFSAKSIAGYKSGYPLLSCFREFSAFLNNLWPNPSRSSEIMTEKQSPITHDWFWMNLGKWLKRGDIVLTETGTSSFGIWNTTLPHDAIFIAQYLWSSIGYTIGACQGAALAARDSDNKHRRTILFIGDGSFQCGCQELSTIIRNCLRPMM